MPDNTQLPTGTGGDVIATDELATLNGGASSGVKVQRAKVGYGADGDFNDVSVNTPLPVMIREDDRTFVQAFNSGVTAGTTGTEALVNLNWATIPGTAPAAGSSFNIPAGKRFRISSITVSQRGNATATAASITTSVRVNTGGAVATTSPILAQFRTGTPATALAWDRVTHSWGDNGPEVAGGASVNIGVTVNPTFTTNAPTYDVLLVGYLF